MNSINHKKKKRFFGFLAILILFPLLIALLQYLWNTLMTDIFQLKEISYWQALGLFVLAKILFGGGPGGKGRFRQDNRKMDAWEKHHLPEDISDEERERIREEWKRRFDSKCNFRNC